MTASASFLGAIAVSLAATAAAAPPSALFAPLALPVPASQTRAAAGIPGPAYWQNRADYSIAATIDPATRILSGSETITYTNNSPDPLDVLWLQLDQNIYRPDARAAAMPDRPPRMPDQTTQGDQLAAVTLEQNGRVTTPELQVSDTRLQLRLRQPVPSRATVKLHIAWRYAIPGPWGGRTAVSPSPDGDIYEVAQWYPRMAVYDDLRGWDTAPYLGSEFYLEYGDIDYALTVPANWIVAGSGALQNPDQVLTPDQRARLAQAASTGAPVLIRGPGEIGAPAPAPGRKTWRFKMAHTRDVAFAASSAFVWDAARVDLPAGRHALAMSVYPRQSLGAAKWGRSTEYVKFAIEHFSSRWFPYPWPTMINVGGHGAGMEYPGIVFDDRADAGRDLFWITVHEVGHSWFPMIVGSNERRDAWMDEGFNTFIDVGASDAFHNGEFAPKRDPEYAPGGGNPADEILPLLRDPKAPVIMTPADQISENYRHPVSYFKPAFGLVLLRQTVLGPARFDAAFRRYIAAWAYRHPSPSDFFRLMSSQAGEDLVWFWRGWFFGNAPLDLSLDSARYLAGDPARGLQLAITAHTPLLLPVPIETRDPDGARRRFTLPVEAFMQGATAQITLPTDRPVALVILDPDHELPDATRAHHRLSPQ